MRIADGQLGLVTRAQLLGLGLSRALVDKSVQLGRVVRIHRGVYAVAPTSSLPPLAPHLAAVLAVGKSAYLSHHAAAQVWKLAPGRQRDIDVTVIGRDAGRSRDGLRVHLATSLDARDVTIRHNIPITVPALTLLDITPDLSSRELERTFDAALKGRIVTRAAVAATVARHPRRPGAARLAALAAAELRASTVSRSRAEEQFLALVRAGGLPEPELNVTIGPYEVDLLWREAGLVVEIDGYEFHSTRRSFEHDHERDQYLTQHHLAVTRFTWDQIITAPEVVLVRLTQRLTELLAAQLGRSSRMVS